MEPPRKRLPGEANPTPDADAPMHAQRPSWMSRESGFGSGGVGIVAGIGSLLAWRKRRKHLKARRNR